MTAELNASGSPVAKYMHGPGIDDPLIVRKSGDDYFYYKNHLGSVTELRDASGAGYKTYVYDAFGNMEETGPTFNRGFTYTARELHNRSGLYYYRARFYDPKLGRFITQDPIGHMGGLNLYGYVENNPANLIDPWGLMWGGTMPPIRYNGHGFEPAHPALEEALGPRNYDFLSDFVLGMGERKRDYDPCSVQTAEVAASPGADALREWFYSGGGEFGFDYRWYRAALDTFGDFSNTAFQVGGFIGTATDNGDGTVTFTIRNDAGMHSFFYHIPFIPDRKGITGPMRTIYQTFTWTEPIR